MLVRPATAADIPQLIPLYEAFYAHNAALQPQSWQPAVCDPAYPQSVIEDPAKDILIALEGEAVLGFLHLTEQDNPEIDCFRPHHYVVALELMVGEAYRRRGVGKALLAAAEPWARAHQADFLQLNVLEEEATAQRLYARQGFLPIQRVLRREL